ncbi:RICIN domain-containing protein [Micromonospora sp. NPDC005203]|uniref:RICIN domain-containing protein n=1 Tax=Micromonospora sp. NPDC005203 TaxID=3364226 RepID=UPI0036B1D6B4
MSDHPEPDPATAGSHAEYVALLRQFREQSELTYRQLQRRAESNGRSLPSSTLHDMLGRDTLPRQELVVALLAAAGADDREISRWVDARRALLLGQQPSGGRAGSAVETGAAPSGNDEAASPNPRRPRRWLLSVGLVTVAAAVTIVVSLNAAHLSGRDDASPPRPPQVESSSGVGSKPPDNGFYRIRAAHSGHCLSERPDREDGAVYQVDCGQVFVDRALDRTDGGYLIRTFHPREGPGCMGVQDASMAIGGVVSDDFCTEPDAKEFTLEPVSAPLSGFRIRPTHSGLCLGVLGASTRRWAPIRQEACDRNGSGQVFRFEPALPAAPDG